jgi:hypothetical protein
LNDETGEMIRFTDFDEFINLDELLLDHIRLEKLNILEDE